MSRSDFMAVSGWEMIRVGSDFGSEISRVLRY